MGMSIQANGEVPILLWRILGPKRLKTLPETFLHLQSPTVHPGGSSSNYPRNGLVESQINLHSRIPQIDRPVQPERQAMRRMP